MGVGYWSPLYCAVNLCEIEIAQTSFDSESQDKATALCGLMDDTKEVSVFCLENSKGKENK